MNAKELRQAADRVRDQYHHDTTSIDPDLVIDIAAHILATVREDDDEDMSWDEAARQESHRTFFHVEARSSCWVAIIDGKRTIAEFKTRGEFRALCRLLGVKIREGQ